MSQKEKADYYREYDLYHCRKYKSQKPEAAHQSKTIKELNKWFISKEFPSGSIVALPTGSGKTFTAVRFLCKHVLANDYKVLWLAHTHHLLEQAFFSFGPLSERLDDGYEVGWIPEPKEKLNVRVVSGTENHFNVNQIKPEDDVLIATLQTIANANKKGHPKFKEFIKSSKGKLFVVFDEAHHAPAPSYRNLILSLREQLPQMYLVGLTATPTYMDVNNRGWLKVLFPQEIVHQVSVKNLIAQEILAKPVIKESETDFNPEFDERMYSKWVETNKDLPESVITKLAENTARNQKITQYYINNKDTYQKTIIFADRFYQCDFISDLLNENGVAADVMYSQQGNERNAEVLDKFRNNDLDVLVNIKMLTEGTDVPDVDSVFITRQTTSLISMTQMVGRALRGPKFGGKPNANLVFFQDDWQKAINWVTWDTETWRAVKTDPENEKMITSPGEGKSILPPDFNIPQLYENDGTYPFLTFMPIGWYKVTVAEPNEDGNPEEVDKLVMVFENEKESFENLIEALKDENIDEFDDENVKLTENKNRLKKWCETFFPKSEKHVGDILKNICDITRHMAQNMKEPPLFIEFEERKNHDLESIAQRFIEKDWGPSVIDQRLISEYKRDDKFWKAIYYDYSTFKSQYNGCVEWILSQKRHIDEIVENEEKILVKKLKGTVDEKTEACQILGAMGAEELLHEKTIKLLENVSKKDEKIEVREAAKRALDIISKLTLTYEEKVKIKERDNYTCLCCGEDDKSYLQVDHIKSRWYELDNSENNLQTLCKICNITKSTDCIDFRTTSTKLERQPSEFPGIDKIDSLKQWEVRDLKWWKKFLRRDLNFFYLCGAVKSIEISDRNPEWRVELHEGNDKTWLDPYIEDLTQKIRSVRKDYGYSGPEEISVSKNHIETDSNGECKILIEELKHGNDFQRARAATRLGNLGCSNAVNELIKALEDPSTYVPLKSAAALGKVKDKKAIKPLINLFKSENPNLRDSAMRALINMGEDAVPELLTSLNHKNAHTRQMSVEALGEISSSGYVEDILKALNDKESTVRWRAARALGNLGDYAGVKPLENALKDSDNKVKAEAKKSLKLIEAKRRELYEKFDNSVLKINAEIIKNPIKDAFSYYSPKRTFLYAHMYDAYRVPLWVYVGKENFNGVKKHKSDPTWGTLFLEREEQLPEALEIVTKSYELIKKLE